LNKAVCRIDEFAYFRKKLYLCGIILRMRVMELTMNIGFGQVVHLLEQMPAKQVAKIRNEFSELYIAEKAKAEITDFQQFLLSAPTMSAEQYSEFNEQREHANLWRTR